MATANLSPALTLVDGIPVVSSVDVANHFGKQHHKVTTSIKSIVRNAPESFATANFGGSEYTDSTGRSVAFFYLTRTGFSLLAMGFTGRKALLWKIAYVQAFDAMEAELLGRALPSSEAPQPEPSRLTTGTERKPLIVAVNKIIGMDGEGPTRQKYMAFWRALNACLGINHINELPASRLQAVQTLLEILATLVTEPETPKLPGALPDDYAALPQCDKVAALLDAFEKTVEYSQTNTYDIEVKLLEVIKRVDIGPGMDHMQGMHIRRMVGDLRIAFQSSMHNVQTSLNNIRPLFWMMSAASKLGERIGVALPAGKSRATRKALTA